MYIYIHIYIYIYICIHNMYVGLQRRFGFRMLFGARVYGCG